MFLIINTANNDFLEVILAKTLRDFAVNKIKGKYKQAENLLVTVEDILKENKVKLADLTGLGVVKGGRGAGFTALRIGIVVANTLAYALKIPVIGILNNEFKDNNGLVDKIGRLLAEYKYRNRTHSASTAGNGNIITPKYSKEPNIG